MRRENLFRLRRPRISDDHSRAVGNLWTHVSTVLRAGDEPPQQIQIAQSNSRARLQRDNSPRSVCPGIQSLGLYESSTIEFCLDRISWRGATLAVMVEHAPTGCQKSILERCEGAQL